MINNTRQPPVLYNPTKASAETQSKNKLIQPKMKRTNTQKQPISMDAISNRLNSQGLKEGAVRPNTTKLVFKSHDNSNDTIVPSNQYKRGASIKMSRQRRKRTSSSKSSKIEGKINEDDMLPLARELTEEELSRYQLNKV